MLQLFIQFLITVAPTCFGITLPSTAPQLSIYNKTLGTVPEDGNVMPKHVGDTIHNLKTE
jgi:hypothetical protein